MVSYFIFEYLNMLVMYVVSLPTYSHSWHICICLLVGFVIGFG